MSSSACDISERERERTVLISFDRENLGIMLYLQEVWLLCNKEKGTSGPVRECVHERQYDICSCLFLSWLLKELDQGAAS
jgi:hypothetical protein